MPLTIVIPEKEFFDPVSSRFLSVKETKLELEHSLLSVYKWESKWHKPYLTPVEKTGEEELDYIRCMCITRNVDPNVFFAIDRKTMKRILDYIADPMTATAIKRVNRKKSRKQLTNELIYFYMAHYGIPFDPCEKWHLNHLLTLIEVASVENEDPKKRPKQSKQQLASERAALNAKRRAKYNSKG